MSTVIPFPSRSQDEPQPPYRFELWDEIDEVTGKPLFGFDVVSADGYWIDGEAFGSRAERDAERGSWKEDWGVDLNHSLRG